ncbi:hypothetical protein, partial [Rubrivirga sp.]|uniref:hypothetical protein n=1 Tax=Rubrivirga sp. TaxID=1885344 RepID=UPI003C742DA9
MTVPIASRLRVSASVPLKPSSPAPSSSKAAVNRPDTTPPRSVEEDGVVEEHATDGTRPEGRTERE